MTKRYLFLVWLWLILLIPTPLPSNHAATGVASHTGIVEPGAYGGHIDSDCTGQGGSGNGGTGC